MSETKYPALYLIVKCNDFYGITTAQYVDMANCYIDMSGNTYSVSNYDKKSLLLHSKFKSNTGGGFFDFNLKDDTSFKELKSADDNVFMYKPMFTDIKEAYRFLRRLTCEAKNNLDELIKRCDKIINGQEVE